MLRTVAVQNHILSGNESRSGRTTIAVRWPITIGSGDVSSLLLSDINWLRTTSDTQNNANDFTMSEVYISNDTMSVQVRKGGNTSWLVTAGMNDSQSDKIYASDFSLPYFARGTTLWLKAKITIASAGLLLPFANGRHTASLAGSQCWWYDSTATTVSATSALGVFTSTGTAPDARNNAYCPIILGEYVNGDPATFFASGDSIFQGQGDSTSTPLGFGMFQRALYGTGSASDLISGINWTKIGGATNGFNNATNDRCCYWSQYCRFAIDEHGTNDFGTSGTGLTASALITAGRITWDKYKNTYGCKKVIRTKLGPRTTSSDSFVTEANQTITGSGWGSGGAVSQYNVLLDNEITLTNIDAVVSMGAWRGVDPTKWVVTGASNYATSDGTHPSAAIHALLSNEIRAVMLSTAATSVDNTTTSINSFKALYTATSLTSDRLVIDGIVFGRLGSTAKFTFRSASIEAAIAKGLISIDTIDSAANTILALQLYANKLGNLQPQNTYLGQ